VGVLLGVLLEDRDARAVAEVDFVGAGVVLREGRAVGVAAGVGVEAGVEE